MEKREDLYLSDEQIIEVNKAGGIAMPGIITEEERIIADASADYAVKEIVRELDDALNDEAYYNHRLWRVGEIVGELKELLDKTDKHNI